MWLRTLVACLVVWLAAPAPAAAQRTETLAFSPHIPNILPRGLALRGQPPAQITGTLRLPPGTGRVPAVLILHGSGGVDGRGHMYGQALAAAGIASFEIDMFTPRGVTQNNIATARPHPLDTLPDVFGALRAMAAHPRLDGGRLGVMGFSFGGMLSTMVATAPVGGTYGLGSPAVRGVMPIYPPCYVFTEGEGPFAAMIGSRFPRVPMLMLAAGRDDYDADGGESCRRLLAAGGPEAQRNATLHVYPNATHAWEGVQTGSFFDRGAARGRGARVTIQRDPAATADSIGRAVAFFREVLR
jgi:dienelactone hydrolase